MTKTPLIVTLERMALPLIHSQGLELWGMELLQSGRPVLRVYVDIAPSSEAQELVGKNSATGSPNESVGSESVVAEEGNVYSKPSVSASIDQCARISRMLGLALEVENVFSSAYVLEVSSPGLSRPFFRVEQLEAYTGDSLEIVLAQSLSHGPESLHGRKKFSGVLMSVNIPEATFCVRVQDAKSEEHDLELQWEMVRKASRVHVFVVPEKPGKQRKKGV